MIRNPKDFGVWSACPSGVHSVITDLEMLPVHVSHLGLRRPNGKERLNPPAR